jgi:hypothetical protein
MDKTAQNFLSNLFRKITPYVLSEEDLKKVSRDKVSFILEKIERKRFRRKLTENTKQKIKEKAIQSLKENKPLHFTIPFGGYKHYWNLSYPEPDWAELFNFRFLTEYVLPILTIYKPGVIIEYISEDLIINRMNNYPRKGLEKHSQIFRRLIEWYKQYAPSNLQIKYFRAGDRCNKNKIIKEIEKVLPERILAFNKLSDEEKSKEIHRSIRSIMWDGEKDLALLNESERNKRIIESRLIELAYYETEAKPEFLGNYLWDDNHICICFSFGLSPDNVFKDLTLASNFGSIVDYWIGRGILEYRNGKFTPRTISKNQYQELKINLEEVNIDPQLLPFRDFQSIEVLVV